MANKDIVRRSVLCPCGGDVYEKTYAVVGAAWGAAWKCDNCRAVTGRTRPHRKTNKQRALAYYLELRDQWAPVDQALDALVASGAVAGGALLVHAGVFNYHLRRLLDAEQPTNFDVFYHRDQARGDLAKAQAFVAERNQPTAGSV
jgi:hypothetical protein